ncbi:low molecular weight protein-tyrosine-phosphatase [Arcanobacterium canis]|uniref:protein-tyrosine-phosphatase n=1 Tax=Arcanobacterium canis TaxID=999183 RepID=A0ABY8G0W2_9ACTO|nr:low molecular weight protein-tyrosine-phosphatase [Arcanobacterium canis]WFM83458.1 low molecular weight phosphotyrosine protein phosphatase [Arcanobacterium canis]
MKILVVCTGNICRSPMGEVVLRERLKEAGIKAEVGSAGVSTEETGNPIDPRARRVLAAHGYPVPARSAHQATARELQADIVLAMTAGHAKSLRRMMERTGSDLSRLHLWREFDGSTPIAPQGVFGPGGALAPDGVLVSAPGRGTGSGHSSGTGENNRSEFYFSAGVLDVPDPWYGGEEGFEETLATVETGAEGIVAWIKSQS